MTDSFVSNPTVAAAIYTSYPEEVDFEYTATSPHTL